MGILGGWERTKQRYTWIIAKIIPKLITHTKPQTHSVRECGATHILKPKKNPHTDLSYSNHSGLKTIRKSC